MRVSVMVLLSSTVLSSVEMRVSVVVLLSSTVPSRSSTRLEIAVSLASTVLVSSSTRLLIAESLASTVPSSSLIEVAKPCTPESTSSFEYTSRLVRAISASARSERLLLIASDPVSVLSSTTSEDRT
ncbi:hypothetical protein D3C80_1720540 [compost metagenome]